MRIRSDIAGLAAIVAASVAGGTSVGAQQGSAVSCGVIATGTPSLNPQALAAEVAMARNELAGGNAAAAASRLESAIGGASGDARSEALAVLARAYAKLGCRAGFVTAAREGSDAGARSRLALVDAAMTDSAPRPSSLSTPGLPTSSSPFGASERFKSRLSAAQTALSAGSTVAADAAFKSAADSARLLLAQLDARGNDAAAAAARALVTRRALVGFWAPDAAAGRLVVVGDSAAQTFSDSAASALLAPILPDAVGRALVWMDAPEQRAAMRDAVVALGDADAAFVRAEATVAALRTSRASRVADAGRFVRDVKRAGEAVAAAEAKRSALAAQLASRDTTIVKTVGDFRTMMEGKIATVRAQAAQNRARIDSLTPAAQAVGAVTTRFAGEEAAAVKEYLAVADAAESALRQGISRLDIVVKQEALHARLALHDSSVRALRAAYDSVLAAATASEQATIAAIDARIADAVRVSTVARAARDSAAERAVAAGTALLTGRIPALRTSLQGTMTAAAFGAGAAAFFAALEADSSRAPAAEITRRRDAAITALGDALALKSGDEGRADALLQLGELLTRKADADFAAAQRAGAGAAAAATHPDYTNAIARYDELLKRFPNDARADAAAYTLGTLAFMSQKYDDANRAFTLVVANAKSPYRAESSFRLGDGRFEQGSHATGDARHAAFVDAAAAYQRAIDLAPPGSDIYFLSLYKLGWSDYLQAERQASDEYRQAVEVFARLVREVDALPKAQQQRLSLRQEAIDYLAIAITQLGGAEEAVKYLGGISDVGTRMLVLRRVAHALRDQGEFNAAVVAFKGAIAQAPDHENALENRAELVELYQSRMLEPQRAQEARVELLDAMTTTSSWAQANPGRAADLAALREKTLREAGSYALTQARKLTPTVRTVTRTGAAAAAPVAPPAVGSTPEAIAQFASAASLFAKYVAEFPKADSAQRVGALEGDARFGARDWMMAGVAYSRSAAAEGSDAASSAAARRNAVVAFDSALAAAKKGGDTAQRTVVEDSLFAAIERFVATAPDADAKGALIAKGRAASEAKRWDVVADAFSRMATRWPADPFAADAQKFVGDAQYRMGKYSAAQSEWKLAQAAATTANRKAFVDSVVSVRIAAAAQVADSLGRRGEFVAAADSVLMGVAADVPDANKAADVLRNAIEVHLGADSTLRAKGDTAGARLSKLRAIAGIEQLESKYPRYQHTMTYASVRAKLLVDVGRASDAADALAQMAQANPTWPGRADAMVRAAGLLDSIGKPQQAAAAFEKFSAAYPGDKRAADAQFNAAVVLRDAKDPAGAAKSYKAFVARFPKDARVPEANLARWEQLLRANDSAAYNSELGVLCAGWRAPTTAAGITPYTPVCANRAGSAAFKEGMASWDKYAALELDIKTKAQLTRDGVALASAPKQALLRSMTASFARAIASGASEWVAAASFQTGLAQWYYGLFLRDVKLPADITDAQRTGAENGSAQQAQQYFDAALKLWGALVDKAANDKFENAWVEKAKAAIKGEGVPARTKAVAP